jgi:hypothetical protein
MFKCCWRISATLVLLCGISVGAGAATIYNESVSGDLSNSGLTPTVLTVSAGSNQISGTTGRGASGVDRDYFTITVPTGFQISQLTELAGASVGDAVSFIGIQAGTQVTLPTAAITANGLLGWAHYGPVSTDTDLLALMGVAAEGSSGFTPPLPSGNYAFWIQDFGAGTFAYAFDVRVTPTSNASATPEPSSYFMAALGLAALAIISKRKRVRI